MTGQTTLHDHGTPLFDRLRDSKQDKLRAAFDKFHKENPRVYSFFEKFALDMLATGRKKIGARMIFERIRWEIYITTATDDGFKLNDHHTPFYARLFMSKWPQHNGVFETRKAAADE